VRGINLTGLSFDRRDELLGFRKTLVRKSKEYLNGVKTFTIDKKKKQIADYVLSLRDSETDNYKYNVIKSYLDKADIIDGFDFIRDEYINNDFYILINPNDVHDVFIGEEEEDIPNREDYYEISLNVSTQTVYDILVNYILYGEE